MPALLPKTCGQKNQMPESTSDSAVAGGLPILRQAKELLWITRDHLRALQRLDGRVLDLQHELNASLRRIETLLYRLARDQSSEAKERYADPRHLAHFERQVFSQSGEDGILAEIFRRIGSGTKTFVEFGAGDGLENNTAFLLCQGWSGFWLEGDPKLVRQIEAGLGPLIESGHLRIAERFIKAATIAATFCELAIPAEVDLLSIDIDGNDYWIWKALHEYRPRVIVVEYNAIFPPGVRWTILEDPEHRWDGSGYVGASLTSFVELAETRGYSLVACSRNGVNAFFVRFDLLSDAFCGPFSAERLYEPPGYDTLPRPGHQRSYPMLIAGAAAAARASVAR